MSDPPIHNRDRWLAVAVLVLLIGLFLTLVVRPFVSIAEDYDEAIEDIKFRLEGDRRLAKKKTAVLKRVAFIKRQQASSNNFISKESTALASAELQKTVKSTITSGGGELTSTQVVLAREEENFRRIGIRVRMSGNMETLRSVLYELESNRPLLIIDNLNIRSVRGRRNRKTRAMEQSDKLNVNFEVFGYMRI